MQIHQDLSRLGYREIDMLADLLKAYAKNGADFLNEGVQWKYNTYSDSLFLVDQDHNVGMINDDTGNFEQWHYCPFCGHEGFAKDFDHKAEDENEGERNEHEQYIMQVYP